MNIVDSSCWIEYFNETKLDAAIVTAIEDTRNLLVPTITLYEVFKRLLIDKDELVAKSAADRMQEAQIIDLNADLALYAVELSRAHKLPMADSIIYATTMRHCGELWTQDDHFNGLPSVHYYEKPIQVLGS
jgi:PIN domain nuclease of toxin-antitoxin system